MESGDCHVLGYNECCTTDIYQEPYVVNNSGSTIQDVEVGFYLSDSSATADCTSGELFATTVLDLDPGVTTLVGVDFSEPFNGMPPSLDLSSGFFHFCVAVDPDDNVAESDETDNAFVSDYDLFYADNPLQQCS